MSKPIILWCPQRSVSSDDSCTTIVKYSCSTGKTAPAPYESDQTLAHSDSICYIPSLQSLCLKVLTEFPSQLHALESTRLLYKPPEHDGDYDLLRELISAYGTDPPIPDQDILKTVDPRLWATLVQVYTGLPETFRTYEIPLADVHLPLLQEISSTAYFTLITVLELSGRRELHDDTVFNLGQLHSLAALDVSATTLSSWGVKTLAKTILNKPLSSSSNQALSGPWSLRMLSLRNCRQVDDNALPSLLQFPLLSVIGTLVVQLWLLSEA
jgi:hypothetical protein